MKRICILLVMIGLTTLGVIGTVRFGAAHADGSRIGAVVSRHFLSDSFEGTSISRNVWGWYGTNQPNNVTLTQNDGALNMSVSSAATNDFTAGAVTRCKLRGDFDATLSFRLVEWQPYNGVWVTLQAADTGGFEAYRVSWLYNNGDDYGAYLPPAGDTAPATGNESVVRLSRHGATWTGYYLSNNNWVPIASGVGPTSDVALGPGVSNNSGVAPFAGSATTVAFDGFHAIAAEVVCPH